MSRASGWLLGIVAFAAGVVLIGQSNARAQKKPADDKAFKPITRVHDMMEGQELLFDGLRKSIAGKKWHDAQAQAWVLAELANVNARQEADAKYVGFAENMRDRCVELARALKSKDADAAKTLASQVNASCKSCHDVFKKKEERP